MSKFSKTELVELFFHEVDTYIPGIRQGLDVLSSDSSALDSSQELHRLFHNIKGAASQVQLTDLSKGAKVVEDALDLVVEEEQPISDHLLTAITRTTDLLLDYREKHNVAPDDEFLFHQQVVTFFNGGQGELESEDHNSYLEDIRSIFNMLQELAGYLSDNTSDPEYDKKVYGKLSRAVSVLSLTVVEAGMKQQGQITRDFHLLLDRLHKGLIPHQAEISGLLKDFFQFLEVAFSYEDPENEVILTRVRDHFTSLKSLLEAPVQSDETSSPEDEDVDLDRSGFFAEEESDFDSVDIFDELTDAEFLDEELGAESLEELVDDEVEETGVEPEQLEHTTEPATELDAEPEVETEAEPEQEVEPLSEDQQILMDIFGEECEEHLAVIHRSLDLLQDRVDSELSLTPELKDSVSDMRRAVHTLKGAAGMTGLAMLARAAGSIEHMLDWINDQKGCVDPQEVKVIGRGVEVIELLAASPQVSESEPLEQLVGTIDDYLVSQMNLATETTKTTEAMEVAQDITDEEQDDFFAETESMESPDDALLDSTVTVVDDLEGDDFELVAGAEELEPEEAPMTEEQQLLMEIFREECDEHLIIINQSLNFLESKVDGQSEINPELKESLSEMRRAVHTLKGAASMTGVNLLAQGAHSLEDMLDWLHDESDEILPEDVRLIASGVDVIELLSQTPDATESNRLDQLVASLTEYLLVRSSPDGVADGLSEEEVDESQDKAALVPDEIDAIAVDQVVPELPGDLGTLRVRLEDLDELVSIEGELVVARGAMEKMLDEVSSTLVELDNVKENLRRKSQELEVGFEVQSLYGFNPVASGGSGGSGGGKGSKTGPGAMGPIEEMAESDLSDFDPIELDRYSQLNLIIRSLNEISVDVNSIHSTLIGLTSDISGQVGKQQLTMRLMQEKLMRIRMTPLSSISRVMFRTVRDTSTKLGKKVALTITGEDVYMDRFVWARITDPLMHILRNGVDHGIETIEGRKAAGKPLSGTINLQAEQRSRYVVLRISDDGAGVDVAKVRDKITRDRLAVNPQALSEKEVLEFLFHPSFSTRQDVTTISGRGVGLDVVRRNIQDLRGSVQLHNEPGKGVVFEIQIPFTLSVNRAVLVAVAGKDFAIPLQDIQQVKHFYPTEIKEQDGLSVSVDEQDVPLINLGFYLQLEKRIEKVVPAPDGTTGATAILFKSGDEQYAVAIDSVEEQREIFVKDLGSHLVHVPGISGVTFTGTGGLIPILNLRELVEVQVAEGAVELDVQLPPELHEPLKVLIVDDSISVRHSVARLVENQSWIQQQAVDGLDALAKLETFMPDVIILDIEMPRMNGYEFKSSINNQKMYKDIPVVMLTSRASEKHQQKARDLGIQHYLTKPYQDEVFVALLENIKSSS